MVQLPLMKFVYDRRKRATQGKPGSVELEVYYCGKRKYVTTGVRVMPRNWRGGRVSGCLDALELNGALDALMSKARRALQDMMEGDGVELDALVSLLRGVPQRDDGPRQSFLDYCRERVEVRKYGKGEESKTRYDRFMRFFVAWGGIVNFEDVTPDNVIALDKALRTRGLMDSSKWNNYHRFLNSFILDAIDDGLLRRNPYKQVRIDKAKHAHGDKHLTPEEFRLIERAKLPTESMRRVRDLFVFQTYTCLSYVDLAAFDASKVRKVGGQEVYGGYRGKTGQEYVFVLLKPARAILARYGGRLPLISNVKYNQFLKALAQHAGIDKPLSSHWARHTGATLLLNKGVNMEVVAKVLGHSSTKITREVYAKLLDETVVKAMAKL